MTTSQTTSEQTTKEQPQEQAAAAPSPARQYAVAFDSTLGVAIQTYIRRSMDATKAINDFLPTLPEAWAFPVAITTDTEYLTSDDCDAGGLLGVIVSDADLALLTPEAQVMWDHMALTDEPGKSVLFPRVEGRTHYIGYNRAKKLLAKNDPAWEFFPPSPADKKKGYPVRTTILDSVRRIIPKDDLSALTAKGKIAPPQTLLCPARRYELTGCDLKQSGFTPDEQQQLFARAVGLYRAFTSLPSVSANSLARTLQLDGQDVKQPFCEWRADAEHRRYVITTNLTSKLTEMEEMTENS